MSEQSIDLNVLRDDLDQLRTILIDLTTLRVADNTFKEVSKRGSLQSIKSELDAAWYCVSASSAYGGKIYGN